MNKFKGLFISKRKLLRRIISLEDYVGADYKISVHGGYTTEAHEPDRSSWNSNPIAELIIKAEEKGKK